jgi:hypothetical protein
MPFCDSKNFYSRKDLNFVLNQDRRQLQEYGNNWTIYSMDKIDPAKLEDSQYMDTNEIMHRLSVLQDFNYLWSTFHPKRKDINSKQILQRPMIQIWRRE